MEQNYMAERRVLPLVLSMSLPMILSMMVSSLYNIIDSFFVAKISEDAMTALSLVYPVQNFINAVTIGFGIGINAVIAYHLGARQQEKADEAAAQGLLLCVLHGLLLTLICNWIIPGFLAAFTSDQEVISLGLRYSRIVFSFSVIISLGLAFEKIFQAVGKMTVSMASMMCGCIANILLDPVLIFGLGPAPRLGIEGAAIATGIGQLLTLAVYLLFYRLRPIPVRFWKKPLPWNWELTKMLYSIGIPATLSMALPSILVSALNAILAAYSQAYVLVLGSYYKLQTFLYLSANGLIQGIRPLMGYNYGAEEYGRVRKIYSTSLLLTMAIMSAGTLLCLLLPDRLIGLFTDSEEVVQMGVTALRIISAGFVVSSVSIVSSGALEGLGMGSPSLVISLCRYIIVMIPAAFLLSRAIGVTGVWHAFWITEFLAALISWLTYRKFTRFPRQRPPAV